MHPVSRAFLGFAAAIVCAPLAAQELPSYRLASVLQPPEGNPFVVSRLNDAGEVTGNFFNPATTFFDGAIWNADGEPATLSGAFGIESGSAIGIHDDGTVVGGGSLSATSEPERGFVIDPAGAVTLLPSLAGDDGVFSAAFDVNSLGVVVGRSAIIATPFWLSVPNEAVIWEDGEVTSIGSLGGFFARAERVNDLKTVIGQSNTVDSDFPRGFVWDPVNGMREMMPFDPSDPLATAQVTDINEAGVICGRTVVGSVERACFWDDPDGPPTLLPLLPGDVASDATALDEHGTFVGTAITDTGAVQARIWRDGEVHALADLLAEPLPFNLRDALDLTDGGLILVRSGGADPVRAVLEPVPTDPQLTGEPAALSLAAGGTQRLALDAPKHPGQMYVMLGSVTGTTPGLPLAGNTLPLNFDAYFQFTLLHPGAAPFGAFTGLFDANGEALATFTVPTNSPSELAGLLVHHAYVVLDAGNGAILDVSANATTLLLAP